MGTAAQIRVNENEDDGAYDNEGEGRKDKDSKMLKRMMKQRALMMRVVENIFSPAPMQQSKVLTHRQQRAGQERKDDLNNHEVSDVAENGKR